MVENGSKLKVVQVKGVEKQAEDKVSSIGNFVQEQGWNKFEKEGGLVLGSGIAKELDVKVGIGLPCLFLSKTAMNNLLNQLVSQCKLPLFYA